MKKILAVLLTVAMIATMFALSAGAADKENVIGGDTGVDSFDPTPTGGKDLNVQVTEITHKYAVDVTFNLSDLTIGGTITWNVNDMKYDVEGTTLKNTTQTIEVSNRSDLPVYAYATVSDTDTNDSISIAAENDSTTNMLTVAKATAGSGTDSGTATAENLTISIKSEYWNTVAEYYATKRLESTDQATAVFTVATITVTITKDNTNTAGN